MDRLIALSLLFFSSSCAVFVPAERADTDQLMFHYPEAGKVQLIGDWNNWGGITGAIGIVDPACGIMDNNNGTWVASPPDDLERGRYRYAFLVNGSQYFSDSMNPDRTVFSEHEVSILFID